MVLTFCSEPPAAFGYGRTANDFIGEPEAPHISPLTSVPRVERMGMEAFSITALRHPLNLSTAHASVEAVDGAPLRTRRADVRGGRTSEARPPTPLETGVGGSENTPHSDVGDGGRRSCSSGSYSS